MKTHRLLRPLPAFQPLRNLWLVRASIVAGFLLPAIHSFDARATDAVIKSPDGNIAVTVTDEGGLGYSVRMDGREVVARSRFGIVVDGVDLGAEARLSRPSMRKVHESYALSGAHAQATNNCRDAALSVRSAGEAYELEVRAYDDGVALRARLVGKPGRKITGETTEWKLAGNPMAWFQPDFGYEGIFQNSRLEDLPVDKSVPLPITFGLSGGGYALVTEANLLNYSDLGVQVTTNHALRAFFHASPRGWTTDTAVVQPWRVILLARDLNALVNSDLIRNLCPAPAPRLAGAGWIQPGRATWQWWSSGDPVFSDQHQWVDWTRQLGFEYYLVDDGWKRWKDAGRDAWACLLDVCNYASTNDVKIWAWVDSKDIPTATKRTNYMDRLVAAGVSGIKIDFIPKANPQWVGWYEETMRDAAARKLLVDFHGANKPVGRDRTWPNELTRESVRGHEYHILRYRRTLPPQHDCILPFTRLVIGPADYTPTVFNPKELRGYTWAHELAQAVVFTSPFLCYADRPENYLKNPAVDVLKAIPSTWDETVVLPGSEIGACAAFARRKGADWFIGVMNGSAPTTLDLPLEFLGRGRYRMIRLGDADDRDDAWQREEKTVKRDEKLHLVLRPGGGCVVELKPEAVP